MARNTKKNPNKKQNQTPTQQKLPPRQQRYHSTLFYPYTTPNNKCCQTRIRIERERRLRAKAIGTPLVQAKANMRNPVAAIWDQLGVPQMSICIFFGSSMSYQLLAKPACLCVHLLLFYFAGHSLRSYTLRLICLLLPGACDFLALLLVARSLDSNFADKFRK